MTQNGPRAIGPYSTATISGGTVYLSGVLGIVPETGKLAEGGVEAHMAQALSNLDRVLTEAGAGRDQVVQCRIYVTDIENWDAVNRVYSEYFGDHKPARIVVPVPALHFGCLVEIEAVAEL